MHVKFYLNFLWETVVVQKVEKGKFYDKSRCYDKGNSEDLLLE